MPPAEGERDQREAAFRSIWAVSAFSPRRSAGRTIHSMRLLLIAEKEAGTTAFRARSQRARASWK